QVRERYGPAASTVKAVSAWLRSRGFAVGAVPANNAYVEAVGTAAQANTAFAVGLSQYAVNGQELQAPDADLTVPASLAAAISGVTGLSDAVAQSSVAKSVPVDAPPGTRDAAPCSTSWGEKVASVPSFGSYGSALPFLPCGYTPPQLRAAYGIDEAVASGNDGTGTTVAIVDPYATSTILDDAQQYATNHDPDHPLATAQFSQLVAPMRRRHPSPRACSAPMWPFEEAIDVEAVHAMAPGADILYVGASSCSFNDLFAALNTIV